MPRAEEGAASSARQPLLSAAAGGPLDDSVLARPVAAPAPERPLGRGAPSTAWMLPAPPGLPTHTQLNNAPRRPLVPSSLGARRPLVPSSLDEDKCCRICLESTDSADPFDGGRESTTSRVCSHTADARTTGAGLIAPCSCRGTSAWVHRGCLDQWRSTQEDRAFSQCTECKFPYEYLQPAADEEDDRGWLFDGGPLTARRRRWVKFQLFVARDFVAIFVVLQLCICLVSTTVRRMDCGTWLSCASNCSGTAAVQLGENANCVTDFDACCSSGYLVNNVPPLTLMDTTLTSTLAAYYIVGMVISLFVVGLVGLCTQRGCLSTQENRDIARPCGDLAGCSLCACGEAGLAIVAIILVCVGIVCAPSPPISRHRQQSLTRAD